MLIDTLQWRASHAGEQEAFTFLVNGETDEETITYTELDRRARAIGAQLQSLGQAGERALILCPAGLDYIASFYGCLYAGFVAVPAYGPDPRQHVETLRMMARSAQPLLGLTTRATLPALQRAFGPEYPELSRLPWLCVDGLPAGCETHWHRPDIDLDDLAYLVYTSGSTSTPKGVMTSHRNVSQAYREETFHSPRHRGRVVSWAAPSTGMGITGGIIGPVVHGVPSSFMAPEAFSEQPARWIRAISRTHAVRSVAPNFAYDLVVNAIPHAERRQYDLSSWEFPINVGEQARADTIERFEAAFAISGLRPGSTLPLYGMTEARGHMTGPSGVRARILTVDRAQLAEGRAVCLRDGDSRGRMLVGLGAPNADLEMLIVDPAGRTCCDPGHVGEIWVRGTQVSPGYWNDPEATAETFRGYLAHRHPAQRAPGTRSGARARAAETGVGPYLRTGDLGFFHDGDVFIAGRQKEMVIVRGRNIYPPDVELAAERSHRALEGRIGAVFSIDDGTEEQLVVAQEVEQSVDLQAVATAIRRTVATEIGVQAHVVALLPPGSIPRTAMGKTRHSDCRDAFLAGTLPLLLSVRQDHMVRDSGRSDGSEITPLERTLIEIWEQVLGVSPIGVHDHFLDLGGDSLRSLQVLARMREAGMQATLSEFRSYSTIAALAGAMTSPVAPFAGQEPVVGPVSMLPAHLGFLGTCPEIPPGGVTASWFTAAEPLDPQLLALAARHVSFHHDALRMRFTHTGNGWEAGCVAHTPDQLVSYTDLSATPREDRERRMELEEERLRSQIDIRQAILLKIGVVHLGDAPDHLLVVVSHLAIDAVSSGVLLRDLETAYLQLGAGRSVRLPARTTSIRHWGTTFQRVAASAEIRSEIPYWLDVIGGRPAAIPPDMLADDDHQGAVRMVWSPLGSEQTRQLLRLSRERRGFGTGDAFLAAAARAIAARTGSHSLLIDTVHHGREPLVPDMDLSRTLGYFTVEVPVRLELDPGTSPAGSAAQVRAQLQRVPRHGIGFTLLRHSCDVPLCTPLRTTQRLIQVNYTGEHDGAYGGLTLFRLAARPPRDETALSPRTDKLDIQGAVKGGSLYVGLRYHERVYTRTTAEQLIDQTLAELHELVHACS